MQIDQVTQRRAQKGDPAAFEEVLRAHERMIYQVCLRMSGNPEDAMDIAQETAVRVWRNLPGFKGDASLTTWIYRIAVNASLDHLRRRKGKETDSTDELMEKGSMPVAQTQDTPEASIERKETLRQVGEALLRLPEDQRAAVVLRDVQDLPYEQIASVLGINLNTAKSRIARGRKQLAAILKELRQLSANARV